MGNSERGETTIVVWCSMDVRQAQSNPRKTISEQQTEIEPTTWWPVSRSDHLGAKTEMVVN